MGLTTLERVVATRHSSGDDRGDGCASVGGFLVTFMLG